MARSKIAITVDEELLREVLPGLQLLPSLPARGSHTIGDVLRCFPEALRRRLGGPR